MVFKANIYKYFITIYRAYPKDFFIGNTLEIFYSLLYAFLMYIVFGGNLSSSFLSNESTNYLGYIVVGIMVHNFTVRTLLNVSRKLITEKREGTLESVMMTPYNRTFYFISNMTAQTIHTAVEFLFVIPLFIIFGVTIPYCNFIELSIVVLLSLFSFFGLSLLLANVMLYTSDTYISQNTLFTVMFLICGVNFPISYLPNWVQYISSVIPVTHSIKLFRATLLQGESIFLYTNELALLLILSIVYTVIGFSLLKKVEKIAIEKIYA